MLLALFFCVYILTLPLTDLMFSVFFRSTAGGRVVNSVLSNVRCKYIDAVDCVLINVTAERIVAAPGSIIYNYVHPGAEDKNAKTEGNDPAAKRVKRDTPDGSHSNNEVRTSAGDVIVGVFQEDGSQVVINSHAETDGGMQLCVSFYFDV